MEQAETAQRDVGRRNQTAAEVRKLAEEQIGQLGSREEALKKELEELETNREELATAAGTPRARATNGWSKTKEKRGRGEYSTAFCGGCHMRVPPQLLVTSKVNRNWSPAAIAAGSCITHVIWIWRSRSRKQFI